MAQLEFDESTAKQLESIYRTRDAVRRRELVRAALAARPGERVLDVGCGPGFYCLELLADVGPEGSVVGVDASPAMLALAERRCAGHDNVELREADVLSLGLDEATFDAALSVQVLEYVADTQAALAELYRALRPGGRVVLWDFDWSTVSWHSRERERMDRVLAAWDEHLVHRTLPRRLAPAMRAAGFEHVGMQAHSFAGVEFDSESFGPAIIAPIEAFVAERIGAEEADAWAAEQRELGESGEFYFACTQCCFTGRRLA